MLYLAVLTLSVDENNTDPSQPGIKMIKSRIIQISEKEYTMENYTLTRSEKSILEYLVKGLRYKEIALELFISIDTVKCHVKKIYTKLNVHNRSEATLEYLKFIK